LFSSLNRRCCGASARFTASERLPQSPVF
jgi:hypothetical protein